MSGVCSVHCELQLPSCPWALSECLINVDFEELVFKAFISLALRTIFWFQLW